MRVVVAEDSVLFRAGLERLLTEAGHDVVGSVGDADALPGLVDATAPDLAVVDVRMPPWSTGSAGARAAAALHGAHPRLGVVLLSQHIELGHCRELVGAPRFGYLLKDRVLDLDEFHDALRRVAGGGTALDPEVVRALVQASGSPALAGLTPREREVLALVAQGHSNTAVARALSLSDRTVEAHMRSVFTRLGLREDGETHRRVLAVVTYLAAR